MGLTDIRAIAEPIEVIAKRKIYEVKLGLKPKKNQQRINQPKRWISSFHT